jgi:hypothetical protein
LVLDVPIGQADGTNAVSEVAMSDISARLDRVAHPTMRSPIVVAGKAAVATQVLSVYVQHEVPMQPLGYEENVLKALCRSGLKLNDVGVPQTMVDRLRQGTLDELQQACTRIKDYGGEVLKLAPLFGTSHEALAAVDGVLERVGITPDTKPSLSDDYKYLLKAQAPKA